LQEEVTNKTVALSVKASKLTAKALYKAAVAGLKLIKKAHDKAQTPQGRQSVKKLMNHKQATNTIPLDGETRLFDKMARKWNVDYSFHKTGPKKYLLLFKAGQADAVTACLADYAKAFVKRSKDRRPPIRERLKKAGELVTAREPRQREHKREAVRGDR